MLVATRKWRGPMEALRKQRKAYLRTLRTCVCALCWCWNGERRHGLEEGERHARGLLKASDAATKQNAKEALMGLRGHLGCVRGSSFARRCRRGGRASTDSYTSYSKSCLKQGESALKPSTPSRKFPENQTIEKHCRPARDIFGAPVQCYGAPEVAVGVVGSVRSCF